MVALIPVGKKVNLKVMRDGAVRDVQVTVAEREEGKEIASRKDTRENFGMTVQEITPELARRLGMSAPGGVIVTNVREGSPADDAGIQPHDIVLQVNKVKISNMKDFQREISKKTAEDRLLLLIKRGKGTYYVAIRKE